MKAFLLDVYNNFVRTIDVDDKLEDFYAHLDCRCIDIVQLKVGGNTFDVVCDDEGLFREAARVSAVTKNGDPALVGNLMFCHHDDKGNLTGLSDADSLSLSRHLGYAVSEDDVYPIMSGCEW